MNVRAPFLATTAIISTAFLFACGHTARQTSPIAASTSNERVYSFAADSLSGDIVRPSPTCCVKEALSFRADAPTPHGRSVASVLQELSGLRCKLQYVDGSASEVEIRATDPDAVVYHSARPQDDQCNLCFAELELKATVSVSSDDGRIQLSGLSILHELEPGDGYVFEVGSGDLRARGLLQNREPSLTVFLSLPGDIEEPIAEAVAPCATRSASR